MSIRNHVFADIGKKCFANNIVPFIIEEDIKAFYYRGIAEWGNEKGYLLDTCLSAQDKFKTVLEYFRINKARDSTLRQKAENPTPN